MIVRGDRASRLALGGRASREMAIVCTWVGSSIGGRMNGLRRWHDPVAFRPAMPSPALQGRESLRCDEGSHYSVIYMTIPVIVPSKTRLPLTMPWAALMNWRGRCESSLARRYSVSPGTT